MWNSRVMRQSVIFDTCSEGRSVMFNEVKEGEILVRFCQQGKPTMHAGS
jgi:hypothetical protein